jgi:hypothetical protein
MFMFEVSENMERNQKRTVNIPEIEVSTKFLISPPQLLKLSNSPSESMKVGKNLDIDTSGALLWCL